MEMFCVMPRVISIGTYAEIQCVRCFWGDNGAIWSGFLLLECALWRMLSKTKLHSEAETVGKEITGI